MVLIQSSTEAIQLSTLPAVVDGLKISSLLRRNITEAGGICLIGTEMLYSVLMTSLHDGERAYGDPRPHMKAFHY